MYFRNFRLQKAWLPKCLRSLGSGHLWTVNTSKGSKDCLNLHGSNFVICFDHSERTFSSINSVLVVTEMLRLFVNMLSPYDKYTLSVKVSI